MITMTTRERLKLMEEMKRKNDAAWEAEARRHRTVKCECKQLHPGVEWLLKMLCTFFCVILMGVVALMA